MKIRFGWIVCMFVIALWQAVSCQPKDVKSTTVPIILDHNRMLVDAQIQRKDGTWRTARLWIDTGNPDFFICDSLARDLGIDLTEVEKRPEAEKTNPLIVPAPTGVKIGDMLINFQDVTTKVMFRPSWMFTTMHCDANLPSSVLKRYHIIFDYPKLELTVAEPGSIQPRGQKAPAVVFEKNGIVQIDGTIGGEKLSFALDNGSSYSFMSDSLLELLSQKNPDWPRSIGAVGCANIWGWWPNEEIWPVMRLPQMEWGGIKFDNIGIVGLPNFYSKGRDVGTWYSQKTARPVNGFLGPNVFKNYRVEIDFKNSAVYFEKSSKPVEPDLDLVGLTIRQENDQSYIVVGVAQKDGKPSVEGVEQGDKLVQIGNLKATGATMGSVVDALRGKPGDVRVLILEREGKQFTVEATVVHFL
jgi:hypothetical protein